MASVEILNRADGSVAWKVRFADESNRRTSKRFDSLAEAQAFRASKSSGVARRGPTPRTEAQVSRAIETNTRVDAAGCRVWMGSLTNAGYGSLVVTSRENIMRSPIAMGAINASKTHCPQGHEYTPENIYANGPKKTGRLCRTCQLSRRSRQRIARDAGYEVSA